MGEKKGNLQHNRQSGRIYWFGLHDGIRYFSHKERPADIMDNPSLYQNSMTAWQYYH